MRSRALFAAWLLGNLCLAIPVARTQQFVDTLPLPPAGGLGRYLPAADIDGDGDVDFVAITPIGVRLFRNDGCNRFGAGVIVDPMQGTSAAVVADFDGDGDGDIAVFTPASGASTTLYLLRNGGATFTSGVAHQPTTATIQPMWLQAIDIDNDGDLDLVAALGQGQVVINNTALLVLENDGTGQFTDATTNWLAPQGSALIPYIGAKVLDIDADGHSDLLLYQQPFRILRNTGTQFVDETALRLPAMPQAVTTAAVVGDIDGDGDPDLLALPDGQPPRLLLNFAGVYGDVTAFLLAPLPAMEQGAFLDVDHDGDQDLHVRGGSPATAMLVTNAGGGNLLTAQPAPDFVERPGVAQPTQFAMQRCDLEGDGDDDLVLLFDSLGVLRGDGHGHLVDPLAASRLGGSLALDADGDGDVDLLTSAGLAINDGFGGFTTVPYTGVTPPTNATIADFDNDGDDDVAGTTATYLSNGGGSFTAVPFTATGVASGIFAFDFDADGRADLLRLPVLGTPQLLRNVGGGTMVLTQTFPTGNAAFADAADVDGDGDLDLVLSGGITGAAVRLWVQTTPGTFVAGPSTLLGGHAVFAGIASGNPDVAVGSGTGTSPSMFRIQGGALVSVTASTLPPGFTGFDIYARDVDGDGDLDLVGDQLLRNDGTGVLTLEPLGVRASPRGLWDLDGDGDLDLIANISTSAGTSTNICWNREHHLDVPLPAATGRARRLDVSALPGRATPLEFAVVGIGFVRSAPGIATPFGELRVGAIGLTLALQLTPVAGSGTLTLAIPNQPALVGTDLHFQALHISPSGWRLANLASTRIE